MTRRSLLQTGGGALLIALVGAGPWSVAKALAAGDAPAYLCRSTYLPLVGTTFTTASRSLRLEAVTGEREDVFGLTFTGAPLEQGIHELRHPQLGSFALFIAPVGAERDQQVVVDRSVALPKAAPAPTAPTAPTAPASAPATDEPLAPVAQPHRRPLLRHVRVRRAGHGLRCELKLRHPVKRVELRLLRAGRTVAKGHRKLRGTHPSVRLATRHRLPAGEYVLLVVTTDIRGHVTSQTTTVRLP